MAKYEGVSLSVVRRLPRYYRFLEDLLNAGVNRISSRELSAKMGLTASQIRQDLNCFGGFGQQGYGYNVPALRAEIAKILGLENNTEAILVGAGNLGRAIATHMGFETKGFNLSAIFDSSDKVVGQNVRGITVMDTKHLEDYCKKHNPKVAILCIPKDAAKELSEKLVGLGIKAFWNFSHYDMAIDYEGIIVENVHLGDSLMTLCYRINNIENDKLNEN